MKPIYWINDINFHLNIISDNLRKIQPSIVIKTSYLLIGTIYQPFQPQLEQGGKQHKDLQ